MTTVSVLGEVYTISFQDYNSDPMFREDGKGGYCSMREKRIVVCDLSTHPDYRYETKDSRYALENEILRHEIVHAFLFESGLDADSRSAGPWARNEEIIDWIAIQGPKIMKAWKEAKIV